MVRSNIFSSEKVTELLENYSKSFAIYIHSGRSPDDKEIGFLYEVIRILWATDDPRKLASLLSKNFLIFQDIFFLEMFSYWKTENLSTQKLIHFFDEIVPAGSIQFQD